MQDARRESSPRIQTSLAATLVDSDGGELGVEIIDLSANGFRLNAGEPLYVGEEVRLRVSRHGDFEAVIQWVKGCEAGGHFIDPVKL